MDEIETLVFRTDRIGDFIISCPFIKSYKSKFNQTSITIISSEYNFNYVNKFDFIDKTIPLKAGVKLFPKMIILFKMIIKLRKNNYKHIIILDGKARSFFISFFLKGKKSILLQSKKLKLLSRIFRYKFVVNHEIQSQLKNFSYLSNILDFKISNKNPRIHTYLTGFNKFKFLNNFIILHVDEKWFSNLYYSDFTNINPSSNDLDILINKISNIVNKNLNIVITSGSKKIKSLIDLSSNFITDDSSIFKKNYNDRNVFFFDNISIDELTYLVSCSKLVICCEGAISHLSYNFKIPTLALYEKKRIQHTKFWTSHMNNITLYERKKINELLLDNNFFNVIKKLINI
ncbi:glycosyltransferase family 9 protein [Candidatus Pelagibacter sp.]|nr:glycosyltransferase family 9 protein [Candidatus Pelagibacter sp.]|tara:strand:+ start:16 stop:1050 length:1035 start_codon:yes stop_codon:yes gene_type:complete